MKTKLLLVLALALMTTGCAVSFMHSAYIAPEGTCGYVVMLVSAGSTYDVRLSRCLSLKDATDLAAQINKDMEGKRSNSPTR